MFLVGDHRETLHAGVGRQPAIGCRSKLRDRFRLILPGSHPTHHVRKPSGHFRLLCAAEKGIRRGVSHPMLQCVVIAAVEEFGANLVDGDDASRRMMDRQAVPESRTQIESVVPPMRLDEHVGIERVVGG